jgi:rhamnosyl/mannosyltransferase
MKVLHVFKTYFPETQGGLQEAIRQICLGTKPSGFDHTVLTAGYDGTPTTIVHLPEARVVRYGDAVGPASCPVSLGALRGFRGEAARCHVIHYHFPWPFMDLLHLVHRVPKPALVTYHADIVRNRLYLDLYRPVLHLFLASVDRIVATSQFQVESSQVLRRFRDKVEVVPFGLDENSYPRPSMDVIEKVRRVHGEDFFLFVGVLRHYKGLDYLLEASRGESFRVVIAGEGPEGERLRRKAARMGLHNVSFAGHVPDQVKMALFKLCRAVVMPSHLPAEAFGISLAEGAMMGKPLVCCEVGTGTTYVNRHGETGLVVPPADASALRRALRLLARDDELTRRFGEGARARFESHLSFAVMGRRYASLYRELIGGRPGARGNGGGGVP